MFSKLCELALVGLLASVADCVVLPYTSGLDKRIVSSVDSSITLSFKETTICETTPGVKSWAGYINLPPNPAEGRNYPSHTFFWFFESRKDPQNAPLSLWLQGGPGVPSVTAAVGENGPCFVANDSSSTTLNPWSWNNEVNMLYIDQPVQVGFSYDTLINGTIDETVSPVFVTPISTSFNASTLNSTNIPGTFASQNSSVTTNTTETSALVAWHFMQAWMEEFPGYKPKDGKYSIWTESYGGHYGPTFSNFFESQNQKMTNNETCGIPLHLETLGLVNACIDAATQIPLYPVMAYNNTYGLKTINETAAQAGLDAVPQCKSMIAQCQAIAASQDPNVTGAVSEVNTACANAYNYCFKEVAGAFDSSGRDKFDLVSMTPDAFPPKYAAGYFNTAGVQADLGVPLNFTGQSVAVALNFQNTGDFVRGRNLAILGEMLDRGVKVALMYGDRDYQCNWLGGEQISLAINYTGSSGFENSGYAQLNTNENEVGGLVRQYGNLSFTRVFSAGHEVSVYQPEAAYQIFQRTMNGVDVATGNTTVNDSYATTGPSNVMNVTNELPSQAKSACYFWDMLETCTTEQTKQMGNGTAITENFVMVGYIQEDGSAVYY